MNDDSMDVFAKALLYLYQANLENLGIKGELRAVRRVEKPKPPEMEAAG